MAGRFTTSAPVLLLINDVAQNGLPLEDADDLADLLNHLQSEQAYVTKGFAGAAIFALVAALWCGGG
ncbi:hypothetical protein GWG65_27965 [Bradyrhizobium sp. CSA207]|uniref:hypothetical protein n=1 Tax=Bradyrhizobium sp. CSA207 TaxID=2698826 RepID=UPI0023B08EC0|nr:hypothetical protein [Bradyrhizobium sp. CSA207]MDE5445211.1 hypothetical protein [Bradyrhizobium sp. CSA207]